MDVSQLYLSSILADESNPSLLLLSINESQTQISSEWIEFVNSCLRNKSRERVGLAVLKVTINNCSSELFAAHAVHWFQHLLHHLQALTDLSKFRVASHLISSVVQFVPQFPDLSRELAGQLLQNLVTALVSAPIQYFLPSVECISNCIRSMSGPMGPFKNRIEKWLLEQGSGTDERIWQAAAECLALLPRVGGGGQDGVKHAEAWSRWCQRLIATLQCVLTAVLQDTQHDVQNKGCEGQDNDVLIGFGVDDLPTTEPDRMSTLVHRHMFLSHCLYHILTTEFPVFVGVPVALLISLISQSSSIDPRMLAFGAQHAERVPLIAATSSIQRNAYHLLAGLISSCKRSLLPFCSSIDSLFVQTLNWTKGDRINGQFPHSSLRIEVYQVYELWLAVGGNCANSEIVDQMVTHTIADAAANNLEDSRDTNNSTDTLPPPRKKRKRKQLPDQLTTSFGQRKYLFLANKSLCQAALKALCRLVVVRGPQLSANSLQSVLEFVIPLLLDCQQSLLGQSSQTAKSNTWSRFAPDPYGSAQCRLLLYQLLRCCVLSANHLVAAPAQQALSLFSKGIQDTSLEVSLLCQESLALCDLLIHPRLPSLQCTPAPVHPIATDPVANVTSRDDHCTTPTSPASPDNPSLPSLTAGSWPSRESELVHSSASHMQTETVAENGDTVVDQTQIQSKDLSSSRFSERVEEGQQSSSERIASMEQTAEREENMGDTSNMSNIHDNNTNVTCLDLHQSKSGTSIDVNLSENTNVEETVRGDAGIDEMLATFVEAPPDSD